MYLAGTWVSCVQRPIQMNGKEKSFGMRIKLWYLKTFLLRVKHDKQKVMFRHALIIGDTHKWK